MWSPSRNIDTSTSISPETVRGLKRRVSKTMPVNGELMRTGRAHSLRILVALIQCWDALENHSRWRGGRELENGTGGIDQIHHRSKKRRWCRRIDETGGLH